MRPFPLALAGLAALLGTTSAHAAGIERAVPSTRVLFEPGSYAEFSLAYTDPDQSGDDVNLAPIGLPFAFSGDTGDLFESYWNLGAAWKNDITEQLSYAVIFDQPYGADTSFGQGSFPPGFPPSGFSYDGTSAELDAYQLTGILAYDVRPDVKLYGGVRAQRIDASAAIPFVGPTAPPPLGPLPGYTIETDTDWGYGWLVGAAYQRPEIALRVALTYYSEIDHDFETEEFGRFDTDTDISTPRSVNLEFQSGIAEGTLIFGSVRWVDWSEFAIEPPTYLLATGGRALVDYPEDWTTYTLGVGRQITDKLAGAFSISYEPEVNEVLTTLGPFDGRKTATLALTYDTGRTVVTGGITYGRLGDTENILETDFDDGSVWGAGLRVGYRF